MYIRNADGFVMGLLWHGTLLVAAYAPRTSGATVSLVLGRLSNITAHALQAPSRRTFDPSRQKLFRASDEGTLTVAAIVAREAVALAWLAPGDCVVASYQCRCSSV